MFQSVRIFSLCAAMALSLLPLRAGAQGEIDRCRAVGQERSYPCALKGDIIRSERQHRSMVRFHERVERREVFGSPERALRDALRNPRERQTDLDYLRRLFDR